MKMLSLLEFEYFILLITYTGYLILEHYPNQKLNSITEKRVIQIANIVIYFVFPAALLLSQMLAI